MLQLWTVGGHWQNGPQCGGTHFQCQRHSMNIRNGRKLINFMFILNLDVHMLRQYNVPYNVYASKNFQQMHQLWRNGWSKKNGEEERSVRWCCCFGYYCYCIPSPVFNPLGTINVAIVFHIHIEAMPHNVL